MKKERTYEEILRKYIEELVKSSHEEGRDRHILYNLRGQAYGALMFAQKADLLPYEILHEMWEGKNGYYEKFPIR